MNHTVLPFYRTRIHSIIFILLLLASCNTSESKRSEEPSNVSVAKAEPSSPEAASYKVFQSLKPKMLTGSKQITIQILQDARLDGLMAHMRYYPGIHAGQLILTSDGRIMNPEEEYKHAILLANDDSGTVKLRYVLDVPCARIDTAYLDEKHGQLAYLLTLDYSTGMGSYNGPLTNFVQFSDTGIVYYRGENGFATTLKSGWAIKYAGDRMEVWSKKCRPADGEDFDITTKKITLQADSFISRTAIKKGFWENETDTSSESLKDFFDSFP